MGPTFYHFSFVQILQRNDPSEPESLGVMSFWGPTGWNHVINIAGSDPYHDHEVIQRSSPPTVPTRSNERMVDLGVLRLLVDV